MYIYIYKYFSYAIFITEDVHCLLVLKWTVYVENYQKYNVTLIQYLPLNFI